MSAPIVAHAHRHDGHLRTDDSGFSFHTGVWTRDAGSTPGPRQVDLRSKAQTA